MIDYASILQQSQLDIILNILEHLSIIGTDGAKQNDCSITLLTRNPDLGLPADVLKKYPQIINIALQHRFYDLVVDRSEKKIRVTVEFSGRTVPLTIPFGDLLVFSDKAGQEVQLADGTIGYQPFSIYAVPPVEIQAILTESTPKEKVDETVTPPVEKDGNIIRPTFGR